MSPDTATRAQANALRALSMDAVEQAGSGHPGMPMGMADVMTALVQDHLVFDPDDPFWPDRDRLVLSAGHGSMLLYSMLHLTGYEVSLDDLKSFRQLGSKTAGHPEYGHCPGVETTTGPLGAGLATAVGMALAERLLNARFGEDLLDHRTYVIAGDGCLMEGISHEAIDLAGHLRLNRLTVLWDDNRISIDGATDLSTSMDQPARFAAAGWHVLSVDGHDQAAVSSAIATARASDRPTLIACRTTIGYGAPTKAATSGVHGSPLGAQELAAAKQALGWPYGPFEVPEAIRAQWAAAAERGRRLRRAWLARVEDPNGAGSALLQRLADPAAEPSQAVEKAVRDLAEGYRHEGTVLASRVASQQVLEVMLEQRQDLLGGSADLSGSNGTQVGAHQAIRPGDYGGDYLHYGVREHAMGAVMNGLALHGGFLPYGGTFLVFADYGRPSIRLAALMNLRVVHVLTHDSIGLGEDGPTHQPVEHLASLRAIPGLKVIRPADAVETAAAWLQVTSGPPGPSALVLSRQNLPALPGSSIDAALRGGYLVHEPDKPRRLTLLASGSEVSLALAAAELLAREGIWTAVVSLPCLEVFDEQPQVYRDQVLGTAARIAVEAAIAQGWERYLRPGDRFIGMSGFGASGPAQALYEHFGITADAVAAAARSVLHEESQYRVRRIRRPSSRSL